MINLFILFTSLLIQFGATEFPVDIISLNSANEIYVKGMVESINDTFGYNLDYTKAIVVRRNNSTYPYYLYYAEESIDPNFVGSSPTTWTRYDDHITINGSNFRRFQIKANYNYATGFSTSINSIGNIYYDSTRASGGLFYNGYYLFSVDDVPTFRVSIDNNASLSVWGDFGSLSSGAYDENGDPIYELKQNHSTGGGWAPSVSGFSPTGHSTGASSSSTSFDFTNPQQNLLGQIVDNTNDIIGNTNLLGNAVNNLSSNVINGSTSIFNAISATNNNLSSTFSYNQDDIDEIVVNSQCYGFIHTSYEAIDEFQQTHDNILSDFQNQETLDELVIPIDLTVWSFGSDYGTITPYNDIYYMRFEFLDETKALWQPLLIGLLYVGMFLTFYFDLPNLLRGHVK